MNFPEKGTFWRHYKHDSTRSPSDHMYEVIGIALHTEDKGQLVIYRPLYENTFLGNADACVRPLDMFMENVMKDDKTFPRFTRITDPAVIEKLEAIKKQMYG